MSRWLVQLSGHDIDLEEFPFWFPDGEVFSIQENQEYFIVGSAFEALSNPEEVLRKAEKAVDQFSAIILLFWPSLQKPEIRCVIRESDDGRRNAYAFSVGTAIARSKARGISGPLPHPTEAQNLLNRALEDQRLEIVIRLWADPIRSWGRLFRILEELEEYLGKPVNAVGLCSAAHRARFTRTANTAEVAGADARHAVGKNEIPDNPMSLDQASEFIGKIILGVLCRNQ
jgi:hypothetical protein